MSSPFDFHSNRSRATVNEPSRRLVVASYFIALLFVLSPVADTLTNVWPWHFDSEQWRFGLVGIASNYLISLVFGLLLAALVAAVSEHRQTLRAIAVVSMLGTVILAVTSATFVLDTVQLRGVVREEQRQLFQIGAVKTMLKVLATMVALLMTAIGSFKAAKALASGRSRA